MSTERLYEWETRIKDTNMKHLVFLLWNKAKRSKET
jgi:hypothetical protein